MMKKFITGLLTFLTLELTANIVDTTLAKTIATNFSTNTYKTDHALSLVFSNDNVYVYGDSSSWYMIPKTDAEEAIIAYSTENSFTEPIDSNVGVYWWFKARNEFIHYLITNDVQPIYDISYQWLQYQNSEFNNSRSTSVGPLCTSTWNQTSPYNKLAPFIPSEGGGQAYAGCVPIALGQHMFFFHWPPKGTGSFSYTDNSSGSTLNLSANYGNTTYEWNNMFNSINNSSNYIPTATLLFQLGVGVKAQWSSVFGTGAYMEEAVYAMKTYFGYNPNAKLLYRHNYTDVQWQTLMDNCLDNHIPLVYAGYDVGGGGHCWIVDGRDANNLNHMNWGWGGSYNGYYSINSPNPAGYNFNGTQQAIFDLFPNGQVNNQCQATTTLNSSNITDSSSTITWSPVTGATSYTLQWKKSTSNIYTDSLTTTLTTTSIKKLMPGTVYNIQVKTNCSSGSSYYVGNTLTTISLCPNPIALTPTKVTTTSYQATWRKGTNVTATNPYWLIYQSSFIGGVSRANIYLQDTFFLVTDCTPNTTYYYYVYDNCKSGEQSQVSNTIFVTTLDTIPPLPPSCPNPNKLPLITKKTKNVNIVTYTWNKVLNASYYTIHVKPTGFSDYVTKNLSDTTLTISYTQKNIPIVDWYVTTTCKISFSEPLPEYISTLRVYPNPANTQLNIHAIPSSQVIIYDIEGSQVFDLQIESDITIIDISNLSQGMYFVESNLDGKLEIAKVLIQR